MTAARKLEQPLMLPKTLRGVNIEFKADRPITEEELMEFCAENDHLRIEQDKNGKLIIMPPVDLEGGTREGIANGVRLAWLIDPLQEKAWIYREDGTVKAFLGFDHVLSGEEVCPGLELDLRKMRI